MAIEQEDLDKAIEIVNSAWVSAVDKHAGSEAVATKIKANAGLQMMRNFLEFAEAEVEKELGEPKGRKLSPEDVIEIAKWKQEHGE